MAFYPDYQLLTRISSLLAAIKQEITKKNGKMIF